MYYHFKNELLEYLHLPVDVKYKMTDIETKIKQKKKITGSEIKQIFPDFKVCNCGVCSVDPPYLIDYIKKNLLIKNDKPPYSFFEFNQEPVTDISFIFS